MDRFERCLQFERRLRHRGSTSVVPFQFGEAFFNDQLPEVYYLNALWVDRRVPLREVAELQRICEYLSARRGLAHREICVSDRLISATGVERFARKGWEVGRGITMVLTQPPARPRRDSRVVEVDRDRFAQFTYDSAKEDPESQKEEVARQLVAAVDHLVEAANARFFGIVISGRIVSGCHLYFDDGIAQIEDVATLTPYRRRGYARQVVRRAIHEALALDPELVFLVADEDDWPKKLYRQLGFKRVGRSYELILKPGASKQS